MGLFSNYKDCPLKKMHLQSTHAKSCWDLVSRVCSCQVTSTLLYLLLTSSSMKRDFKTDFKADFPAVSILLGKRVARITWLSQFCGSHDVQFSTFMSKINF